MDVVLLVDGQDGSHEGVSLAGDAPAAGTLDFGDQSVDVEPLEQARDSGGGEPVWHGRPWGAAELLSNVPVAEALGVR